MAKVISQFFFTLEHDADHRADILSDFATECLREFDWSKYFDDPAVRLKGSVESCNAEEYLARAKATALSLFEEEVQDSAIEYWRKHKKLSENLSDLDICGFFADALNERYSIDAEFNRVDGSYQAVALVESGLFDKWKPQVDAGVWHDDSDPIQAIKNFAADLFLEAVRSFAKELWDKFPKEVKSVKELLKAFYDFCRNQND